MYSVYQYLVRLANRISWCSTSNTATTLFRNVTPRIGSIESESVTPTRHHSLVGSRALCRSRSSGAIQKILPPNCTPNCGTLALHLA
jgi:hypothetical protein